MTIQVNDDFLFQNKNYILIDIEKDKQIIEYADFQMPRKKSWRRSTACVRGYRAQYSIDENKLYGIRYEDDWYDNARYASKKLFIEYTGSCIVAFNNKFDVFNLADFLPTYLDFDEALELHFTYGNLDEVFDLKEAIQEARNLGEIKNDNRIQDYRKAWYEIAFKYLKYEYDHVQSYKWRK